MEKIKVGCVGLGPRGRYLYTALLENENVQPCAVCDIDPEALKIAQKLFDEKYGADSIRYFASYEEFLQSDVEAIIVATGVDTHADLAVAALNAGKHVLCEIPNINSLEDAGKLLRAVRANPKQKFMVAENCCYWAFINTWKKMYDDGALGDIVFAEADYLHMTSHFMDPKKPITWRSFMPAIHYLTHDLGPLLYILNDTCTEISGFVPDFNPIEETHPAPPTGAAMIKTKKGTLIKILIGFGFQHSECTHNYILYGTKGSLENQRFGPYYERTTYADLSSIPNTKGQLEIPVTTSYVNGHGGHGGADPRMMADFIDCIVNDTKPALDIEFGINIALPGILANLSSQEHGKTYSMPSLDEIAKM